MGLWVGKSGFSELSLTETVARLSQSGHPAAKAVADAVTEFVEALAEDDDDPSGRIKFFDRNVAVSGDFIVSRNPVIVLGDLVCGGQYTDLVEADQSLLAVAGELRCRSIWQLGDLFVAGQVTCAEVFYGASYHSNRSEVLGDVKAHALVENGHHFVIHGSLETAARIGRSISVGGRAFQDDGDVSRLKVELVGEGGAIDEERLYQLVCAGESILKKK